MNKETPIETILSNIGKDEETTERFLESFVRQVKKHRLLKDSIILDDEEPEELGNNEIQVHYIGLTIGLLRNKDADSFWNEVVKNM